MKIRILKAIVAAALGIGMGEAFFVLCPFHLALAWPGIVLARVGVMHSWLFAVVLMVGILGWLGLRSRSKAWWQVVVVSLLVSAGYCAIAFLYVTRVPVPLPTTTPYDTVPAQRNTYLQSYEAGYRDSMSGINRTYCFYPEVETRGFYEGSYHGSVVWYRFMGRQMPESRRRFSEIAAGRDGAKVDLR
jgi:hypothetical protein